MALNFEELDRARQARHLAARPAVLSGSFRGEEPEELSLVQQAGDILASPFRGVEGAAQDLYGLADMVAFDSLPDYEERVFGTSRTAVGGLLEGLVNFGIGFVGSGYLLPAAKFASLGRLAPIVRGAARGAVTDFAVFSAHEGRLSDLIQNYPSLQNPVTEYLASDPKDGEAEGRFKNVLEGLGIGAFVELVALGFKAHLAGRDARAKKLPPPEVEEAMDKAVPQEQLAAATRKAMAQEPGEGIPGVIGDPARPEAAQAARGPGLGQPNEAVRSTVEEFAARKGITRPYPDPTKIEVDETRAKAIADAFELAKHAPADPQVKAAYTALGKDVQEQYDFITREKGLKVESWAGEGEPYKNSAAMAADIRDNNHLWFLPTASAFGAGAEGATHPMLADSGFELAGLKLKVNDIFRVVHDYFGHAAEGNQFGPRGEEIAWTLHTHLFSDAALPALTIETRGQNSWVNYGKHLRRADGSIPKRGDPDYAAPATRPFAEQKAAVLPSEFNAPTGRTIPGTPEHAGAILRTMGVSEEQAKELFLTVRRREAPITVDLQGLPPLDPRTNPRRLSPEERLAEGLNLTDLNLSRYRGPEGALQLIRAMPQVFETLGTKGDVARRTLKEQEVTGLQALADIVGAGPNQRHRLLVMLQQDENTIIGVNRRAIGYRVALQAAGDDAYRSMQKAIAPNGGDGDLLEFIEALKFHHDVQGAVMGVIGEQGRGLGSNRIPTKYVADMFSREEIGEALHQRGGKQQALDLAKKFRTLYESTLDPAKRAARVGDLARGVAGRRAFNVTMEYWINSLLGRPTTIVTAALSNTLTTIYRPLESLIGAGLTGRSDIMLDSVREIVGLAHSAKEAWQATVAALRGGGELLDPKSMVSDIHDSTRRAISPEALGADPNSVHGHALKWVGRMVRYPSATLNAVDQFFKQLNYRAIGRSQLTRDVLAANPGMGREQVAGMVEEQLGKLIHRGQAYGNAQLFHRGVEDAVRSGLTDKLAVDEHARSFVTKYLSDPTKAAERSRLSAVGEIALQRANEVSFTTPLTPGTIPYRYQEAVLNHPVLRIITPFVRTPTNILGFGFDRNVNAITGVAQLLASRAFPKAIAPALESSKNRLVMDILSNDPRRKAEAAGRLALGMSTTAYILLLAAETADDGRPLITGYGPRDVETRRLLEADGWQQYSIRVGDGYASYGRLDPFATMIGVAADVMNYIKFAAPEDQEIVESTGYGFAVALASNLTNKTYLSGLANALDMLGDPQKEFPRWVNTLAASFVPGQAAAGVAVADPFMREVRSMLDAGRARWPGASDDLPPLRNVLGEPVRRAQSLGSGMSSITNAFVPVLYREVGDDLINKEFARLQHGFTPPKRVRGGLDLTTVVRADGRNAFDRWLELHGEVKLGGKNLRASLRRLMTSPNYTRIPSESTDELASPRVALIQSVIEDYRARAYQQVVREFPELGQADRARFQRKAALKRGVETRPEIVNALRPQPGAVNQATTGIVNALTGR